MNTTTENAGSWIEDEDGWSIDAGKSFLFWGEEAGAEHGFTVGIFEKFATDEYVKQTLADVIARFPDQSVDDEYLDRDVRFFEMTPLSAWTLPAGPLTFGVPLDDD